LTERPKPKPSDERYRVIRNVTLVGAVVNLVLSVVKILLGIVGHSQALVADGIHSLGDLASDFIVLLAAKHANKEADEDHPYGHGRIETLISVGLGFFLIGLAAFIMFDAVSRIIQPERLLHPNAFALGAAVFSIAANEFLFRYTLKAAKKTRSNMLHANAWHHRSDAISSVIALVGIGGAMAGIEFLDSVAAIGVSALIAKVGWDIAWRSLRELVDTALDEEKVNEIRNKILNVDGVKAVHSLRTRSMGGEALVDVHILVKNPKISVSEGHYISENVLYTLINHFEEINDVVVHIDPEDDELHPKSSHLPARQEVLTRLDNYWIKTPLHESVQNITLHYLDGRIHVELELPLSSIAAQTDQAKEIQAAFTQSIETDPDIATIKVKFT